MCSVLTIIYVLNIINVNIAYIYVKISYALKLKSINIVLLKFVLTIEKLVEIVETKNIINNKMFVSYVC